MRTLKARAAASSARAYSSITGCWNTPQAAGRPVSSWMQAPAARMAQEWAAVNLELDMGRHSSLFGDSMPFLVDNPGPDSI